MNNMIHQKYLERLPNISHVQVITAHDGLEGYNMFVKHSESSRVTLVLTDCEMPVMDGNESVKKMREYEQQKGLKPAYIIGLSGNGGNEFARKCKLYGMDEAYSKPLSMDKLEKIVKKVFE